MQTISETVGDSHIHGTCDPAFSGVAQAFIDNFAAHNEAGASVCINIAGSNRVHLWGGVSDIKSAAPWQADTISLVFSCTKAATALCAHILIDRGALDLHAPVSRYWPEFAANGKQDATVEMMLTHSVGVPALREPVRDGGFYDWDYMIERIAAEPPFWEPGTRNGYHMVNFGWTVGELVRRVSGRSLGTFFQDEVAGPLGLDFWIGLPEAQESRVARMLGWVPDKGAPQMPFTRALIADKQSLPFLALLNSGGYVADSRAGRAAEIGGGGGVTNAHGLAGMFNPLANDGVHNGVRLVSADHITRMSEVAVATQCDATLLMPTRFGLGFMRSMDNRHRPTGYMESAVLGRCAFGHAGAGGSMGFADPECRLAFGYSMNRMGAGILLNERGQALVDATYRALGYRTDAPGCWIQ